MRRPVHLLILVSLLMTVVAPISHAQPSNPWADSVQSIGNGASPDDGWGFSLTNHRLVGFHTQATTTQFGLSDIRVDGSQMLESIEWIAGTWALDGPLAVLTDGDDRGALSIHDNPFGWLTVRGQSGTVNLTGTEAWTVDPDKQGATSGNARVHLDQEGTLAAEGKRLMASFVSTVGLAVMMATESNIHDHAPRAGAWAHIALGPEGDAASDWLRVRAAPFRLAEWADGKLALDTVGTIGEGAEDLLIRLDIHGLEPGIPRPILRLANTFAVEAPLDTILGDKRGSFSFNATETEVWIRLPAGLSGRITFEDDRTPATLQVSQANIDPWAPHERIPTLLASASEPGTAVLRIGDDYEKRTLQQAYEHTFRLIGLEPDTNHSYTVTHTDLAGNKATASGVFKTGKAPDGDRYINITATRFDTGTWRVLANVTDETGAPVVKSVTAFLDKQPVTAVFDGTQWAFTLTQLSPGPHELAFEAMGPSGRTREVALIEEPAPIPGPDEESPSPLGLALIGLVAAAIVRRASLSVPTSPQP